MIGVPAAVASFLVVTQEFQEKIQARPVTIDTINQQNRERTSLVFP